MKESKVHNFVPLLEMANFSNFQFIFAPFRYEQLPKKFIANVIKTGTFCRTMLPVFIPLGLYQYIRSIDHDKYSEELLLDYAKKENMQEKDAKSFFDASMKNGHRNWRIQYDLYLIDKAVNL